MRAYTTRRRSDNVLESRRTVHTHGMTPFGLFSLFPLPLNEQFSLKSHSRCRRRRRRRRFSRSFFFVLPFPARLERKLLRQPDVVPS